MKLIYFKPEQDESYKELEKALNLPPMVNSIIVDEVFVEDSKLTLVQIKFYITKEQAEELFKFSLGLNNEC